MIKFSKWLWRRAEKVTAAAIIDMINLQFPKLERPEVTGGTPAQNRDYSHRMYAWVKIQKILADVQDRYFPEVREEFEAAMRTDDLAMSRSISKILKEEPIDAKKTDQN